MTDVPDGLPYQALGFSNGLLSTGPAWIRVDPGRLRVWGIPFMWRDFDAKDQIVLRWRTLRLALPGGKQGLVLNTRLGESLVAPVASPRDDFRQALVNAGFAVEDEDA